MMQFLKYLSLINEQKYIRYTYIYIQKLHIYVKMKKVNTALKIGKLVYYKKKSVTETTFRLKELILF